MAAGMRVELVPLSRFEGAKVNPKDHDIGALTQSFQRFGAVETPVVDGRTGRLVAGHGRVEALQALKKEGGKPPRGVEVKDGEWLVPALHGWASKNDAEAKAYLLASNRTTELGGWDQEGLEKLLVELATEGELEGTGWDADDVNKLIAPEEVDEEFEEPLDVWVKPGDMFELGEHRIVCGDSTDAKVYDRLLGKEMCDACLTDPPYGVGFEYESYDDTKQNLAVLIAGFLPIVRERVGVVLLTPGNMNHRMYPEPTWTLCWAVPAGSGRGPWGFTMWQPVLAYGKDPYLARGMGCRPDTYITNDSSHDADSEKHSCAKPMGVWRWFLERVSPKRGETILEPFSGSGTTLLACESMGRKCRAIELEPRYVQLAVERWEKMTGKKHVKL